MRCEKIKNKSKACALLLFLRIIYERIKTYCRISCEV